jgi:hypothetical protein
MRFDFAYNGNTTVESGATQTRMSFAPDVKREPTYFSGELHQSLLFREAISALHDIVVGDLRYKPKDKSAYKEWAAQQEALDLQVITAQHADVAAKVQAMQAELKELNDRRDRRMRPFNQARSRFRQYAWQKRLAISFLLDPVITVHPDELFFECFSQDEATYGRLGVDYEVFGHVGEFACGTTNIDYSAALYQEFQKIRTYKTTRFEVDPSGFEVQTTNEDAFREVKIDLPDSWVRGFLQVSSAMTLPSVRCELHPMDIHNLCFVLRRHKEKQGPRGMRYHLKPGEPVRVVFEPWETEVVCPRSIFQGEEPHEIRVWGRRRVLTLERLIPIARKFTVHLLGTGLPSFYVADLGPLSFTLGLSGWTANDWSRAGNFDLMAPRAEVDDLTKRRVFTALKQGWMDDADALARHLELDRKVVLGALSAYAQAGRVMFDLNKQLYRVRELSREPLPLEQLRFANPREADATRFIEANAVTLTERRLDTASLLHLSGRVRVNDKVVNPRLTLNRDEQLASAECACNWYQQNKLRQGPCEHVLALRMQYARERR